MWMLCKIMSVLIIKGTSHRLYLCVSACADFLAKEYIIGNPNIAHFHTYQKGIFSSNLTYNINVH